MGTIADTAIGSILGLMVVAAMFVVIWVAGDSSARAGTAATQATQTQATLESARNHRSPVTRTSIAPEPLRAPPATEPH